MVKKCRANNDGHDHCHEQDNKTSEMDIFKAAKSGDLQMCLLLIAAKGDEILKKRDCSGHTPFHWACLGGYTKIVEVMIEKGAPLNEQSKNDHGPRPIHWACSQGHIVIVDILLQHNIPIDAPDNKQCTPLIIAAQFGKADLCSYLIGKGANIHAVDEEGDTALHWAAFKGYSDLVQLFLYSGFNANQKDKVGQSPLHLACLSGNLLTVQELVVMDVSMSERDNNQKTPLMLAIGRNHEAIANYLYRQQSRYIKFTLRDLVLGPPGRSKAPFLFVLVNIIFIGYPIYFYMVIPETYSEMPSIHHFFIFFNLTMWLSFYSASTRDPGFLARDTEDYKLSLKQVALRDDWLDKTDSSFSRICHTCRLVKPLRSKHCRVCNRCVRTFDHHCPYLNNCIGIRNRVMFFLFVVSLLLCCFITLYFSVTLTQRNGVNILIIIGMLETIIACAGVSCLMLVHVGNMLANLTSNERMNQKRYSYLKDSAGKFFNPFDRGIIKNILEHFHIIKQRELKHNAGEII